MLGNCGASVTNVGKFFKQLEEQGSAVNVATLMGHGTLREAAMGGSFDRIPTEAEMGTMKEVVEQGMKEGAFGLSTGLIYLPGTFAKTEEIIELAKVAGAHDGIYTSHMRSESSEIDEALAELIKSDPERAIALSLPAQIRGRLPSAVSQKLEVRVSGIGEFSVTQAMPTIDGPPVKGIERSVKLRGEAWGCR